MKLRNLLLAASLIAAPLPAFATNDTVTVTLTTVAAACSSGCTRVLQGPSGINLIPLMLAAYQTPCNVSINGTCTTTQVFSYFAGLVGSNLKSDIQAAQTTTATATAVAGVTPVPIQ